MALAAAMVGGFLILRYQPLRKKLHAVHQAKSKHLLTIAKGSADRKQLPALQQRVLKLQNQLQNYKQNIPSKRDLGRFLSTIADLMKQHHLKQQVVAPGPEIETDRLNCIPIDMQCKGRLNQLFEFYKHLQQLPRLVRINKVQLLNDPHFDGLVTMHTKAVIYYRTQPPKGKDI